jgi:hypothetical protein
MALSRPHLRKIFTDKNNYLIASLITGFLAAIFGFICINIGLNVYRAQNWMENSCVIQDMKISGRAKKIFIKYRYNFNNIDYIGGRYNLGGQHISSRSIFAGNPKLEDFIKNYQIGSIKTIYINPKDPTESVLNNKMDSILFKEILFYYLIPSTWLFVISFIYFRRLRSFNSQT